MNTPFVLCDNLVKIYKIADLEVVALQGLDLAVQQGEMLGIVGASGSGKTTLLNVLGGLDRPSAGRVMVDRLDLLKAPPQGLDRYRREQVGFVWQQTTRNLIPYLTALENVALPILINGRERQAWAEELLAAVGLWEKRDSKPAQLSGGQQQRVAIAIALANQPKLLLGDEPTGELDTQTAAGIMELFHQVNEQYGTTILLVTHDPATAAAMNRVVTIRDGRTSAETVRRAAETATTPAEQPSPTLFEQYIVVDAVGRLQLPEQVIEEAGIGRRVTVERAENGVFLRPADGPAAGASELPTSPQDLAPKPSPWRSLFDEAKTLIKVKDVWRTYGEGDQGVHALRGVHLTVPHGRFVALRGRSGSGKTTLLNCIGGLDTPTQGEIEIAGRLVHRLTEAERLALRREQIGFVFQSFSLLMSYTAQENIELMLRLAGYPRRQWAGRVRDVLALVGLVKWAEHRPHEMSGGQQQRVAIARAIAPRPGLILADEPTGELDTATGQAILQLLRDVADTQDTTVVLATHDPAVDEYADEVHLLQDGQVRSEA